MDIIKLVKETMNNFSLNSCDQREVPKLLAIIQKEVSGTKTKLSSLNFKVVEKNEEIKTLTDENKRIKISQENALSHCELMEPLFDKFKKQSIGRLQLLSITDETKLSITQKITNAEYSDQIMDILENIELKCKETFSSNNKFFGKLNNKNVINPKNYKSGS